MVPEPERLERAAIEDLHRAATPAQRRELGLKAVEIGTALVSIAGRLPDSAVVINRALGLGLAGAATRETVQAIVAAYREAGVGRYYLQIHPDARPPELRQWLEAEGLAPGRAWQYFSRESDDVPALETDLLVREIGPSYGEAFGETVSAAFDLGAAATPWLARLPGREHWHCFMSFYHHEAVGAGALFAHGDAAWFYFDATAPSFRRRGSQGALLASRIRLARKLGCRRLYICAGVAVPGQPEHSLSNIDKAGFCEAYRRENYAPPGSSP